jgi:CheY-like chemotaxis protein
MITRYIATRFAAPWLRRARRARPSKRRASPGCSTALEHHPRADLLLLDLNLPGAYGFSALAHLRGSHPGVARHRRLGHG